MAKARGFILKLLFEGPEKFIFIKDGSFPYFKIVKGQLIAHTSGKSDVYDGEKILLQPTVYFEHEGKNYAKKIDYFAGFVIKCGATKKRTKHGMGYLVIDYDIYNHLAGIPVNYSNGNLPFIRLYEIKDSVSYRYDREQKEYNLWYDFGPFLKNTGHSPFDNKEYILRVNHPKYENFTTHIPYAVVLKYKMVNELGELVKRPFVKRYNYSAEGDETTLQVIGFALTEEGAKELTHYFYRQGTRKKIASENNWDWEYASKQTSDVTLKCPIPMSSLIEDQN